MTTTSSPATSSSTTVLKTSEIVLGDDYEHEASEHDTLKLTCPIDSSTNAEASTKLDDDQNKEDTTDDTEQDDDEWISSVESSSSVLNNDESDYDPAVSASDYETNRNLRGLKKRSSKSKKAVDSRHQQLAVIQWFKNNQKISKFKSTRYQIDGASLVIADVIADDTGNYRCKYISGFGTSTVSTVNLRVNTKSETSVSASVKTSKGETKSRQSTQQKAPIFVGGKSGMRYKFRKLKGANVRLNCRATGTPKPDVLWYKNGEILSEEDYGITRFVKLFLLCLFSIHLLIDQTNR